MPKQYTGMGLTLLYPDSWKATEDEQAERGHGLLLENASGSFLSINLLDDQPDPEEVVLQAAEAMEAEYDEVESEELTIEIDKQAVNCLVQRFYYLDFVIVSKLLAIPFNEEVYLVQIQGEDRDIDQHNMVFEAILTSMVRSLQQRTA
jgi:hypothetical protein